MHTSHLAPSPVAKGVVVQRVVERVELSARLKAVGWRQNAVVRVVERRVKAVLLVHADHELLELWEEVALQRSERVRPSPDCGGGTAEGARG